MCSLPGLNYFGLPRGSLVYEVIGQFRTSYFFLTKKPWTHKNVNQTKTNWQNKKKQTKDNKGNKFSRAQGLLRGWKSVFLHFGAFLRSRFRKKNWLEIVLITSFYYAMYVYPYQPTYRAFLFVTICENLFLWELFFIRENVFFFMRILFHLWEFFFKRTLFYLWESMYLWK